jgi:uncharacterized protein (TIGR02996 family)
MSTEEGFLQAIQADTADATAKVVYADWLEERGELEKADYLRLLATLGWPLRGRRPSAQRQRLLDLHGRLPEPWRDLVHGAVWMWDAPTMLALGRLQGVLQGYADCSMHASDVGFFFEAHLQPRSGTVAEMAPQWFPEEYHPIVVEPLADHEADLRAVLGEWLFLELRHVAHPGLRFAFQTAEGRSFLTDRLIARVREVITPVAGWRVQITRNRFYALRWEDIALEAADRVLHLHFSFSD